MGKEGKQILPIYSENLKIHYTVVCKFDKHVAARRGRVDAIARCASIAPFPFKKNGWQKDYQPAGWWAVQDLNL
jgi:hypothetical protein